MSKLLLENISHEELKKMLNRLYTYLKKHLPKMDRDPKLFFHKDKKNAEDILGKTGYYSPSEEEIHLYIRDRHPKDVLRSFAHEIIHHEQNCSGFTAKLDMSATKEIDYASKNPGLRKAEQDAFERGNMLFRDWTDSLKVKNSKEKDIMAENKLGDLDKDGKLSSYEKNRTEKIQAAMKKNKSKGSKDNKDNKDNKKNKNKKDVEEAKKLAKKQARDHVKHHLGNEETVEENEQENLQESVFPYPKILEMDKKERVLLDKTFEKRENIVYDELLKKFGIKK